MLFINCVRLLCRTSYAAALSAAAGTEGKRGATFCRDTAAEFESEVALSMHDVQMSTYPGRTDFQCCCHLSGNAKRSIHKKLSGMRKVE
jgi:hypothetical protein